MTAIHSIEVLPVKDNAGDIRLTLEAFKAAELPKHVNVARDGNGSIQKPARYDIFLALIRACDNLWFRVVQLPSMSKEAAA